jgi:branched-chain amino acid transport system permease protein
MDIAVVLALEALNGIAGLALMCAGLAIIFGMMRILNFAHGEFLMLGSYAAVVSTNAGINIWVSMLIVAPLVVGTFGVLVERLLIQFLYGRMFDSLLATWGLSLAMIGMVTTIFGTTTAGVSAPVGSLGIGDYSVSGYRLLLILLSVVIYASIYVALRYGRAGLIARATMQNPEMAASLGINPGRVYAVTFGIGAALSGLGGGLLAPIMGVVPTIGAVYIAKAFITVISGGVAIVSGTISAATLLGGVSQIATYTTTPVLGEAALLIAAIILLWLLPRGISGRFFRRGV